MSAVHRRRQALEAAGRTVVNLDPDAHMREARALALSPDGFGYDMAPLIETALAALAAADDLAVDECAAEVDRVLGVLVTHAAGLGALASSTIIAGRYRDTLHLEGTFLTPDPPARR